MPIVTHSVNMISNFIFRRRRLKIGLPFTLVVALVVVIASVMHVEANNYYNNDNKQITSRSISIGTVLRRFFPTWKYTVHLVQTPSSSSSATGSTDLTTVVTTINNNATILKSLIENVNNVQVKMITRSIFVKGIIMEYSFHSGSNFTASTNSTDTVSPYTLLRGSGNEISTLQSLGQHKLTVTFKGWFGIQLGSSQTIIWNVVSDSTLGEKIDVVGDTQLWHKITLVFHNGPSTSESSTPNPFTDYRLDVEFCNNETGTVMTVPGYYAADGNAHDTSAASGRVWHCHFAPTEVGSWSWQASFRTGPNIAMANVGDVGGSIVSPIHGSSGSFIVQPSNKTGIDLRGKGLLRRVKGKHHLQFAGNGEWFLKAGADSPENFLAYNDFDNTPDNGRRRKSWSSHIIDYVSGDPTWAGDKGKGIIGAINYLSGQGMRSFSFLTMNIDGDDNNVYPYVNPSDRLRFDVSKLAQWEVVFEHGTKKGMFLHFKTQERENDQLLDQGELGNERKLYYRELIARFGHNLALNWNIGEENTNTVEQQKEFADWFKRLDPYQHPVVIHTWPTEQALVYGPLYGHPNYDGASVQSDAQNVFRDTLARIQDSVAADNPWVVTNDEQGSADVGVVPDRVDPNHDSIRRNVLWGNIMAGGAGVEYYFGYRYENSDLTCEDYRSRANMWLQSKYALEFFASNNIPFQDMVNANSRITNNNWCLVESSLGHTIVVYLRQGGTATVDLSGLGAGASTMSVHWYNTRDGGRLQTGSVSTIRYGNSAESIGTAPNNVQRDWVVLLRCFSDC